MEHTHFEENSIQTEISSFLFPSDMKTVITKEYMEENGYLANDIRPAVIGEKSHIEVFEKLNKNLPSPIYMGIHNHLIQDIVYDEFIRAQIDCSRKYEDVFVVDGIVLNGKEVRTYISKLEQMGVYLLAKLLYKQNKITANQEWFDTVVFKALKKEYPIELTENTIKFMRLNTTINEAITNHNWSLYQGDRLVNNYFIMYNEIGE